MHSISGRVKTRQSLQEKIARKGKYSSLSEITDLMGIRIISYFDDDLSKIANLIEDNFYIDVDNSIDKRNSLDPDRFGYMSMHYVVRLNDERLSLRENESYRDTKFEIQVRTVLQHGWAEVEHDLGYKLKSEVPDHIRRKFSQAASLLELSDRLFSEIRQEISLYETDIAQKVQHSLDVPIDDASLSIYLRSEKYLTTLRNLISKNEVHVDFESKKRVIISAEFSKLSGFKTLKDLDNFITENAELIHLMIKLGYRDKDNVPPSMIYQLAVLTRGLMDDREFVKDRIKKDSTSKTYDILRAHYELAFAMLNSQKILISDIEKAEAAT